MSARAVAEPAHDGPQFYAEPTLAAGSTKHLSGDILEGGPLVLNRAALGLRRHDEWSEFRIGGALVAAGGDLSHSSTLGIGVEAEASVRLADDVRLGGRLGLDHHGFVRRATSDGTTLVPMVGVRARFRDAVAIGADAFYVHYDSDLWGRSTAVGAMATLSLDGRLGRGVGIGNAVVLTLGFAIAFMIAASGE